MKTPVKNLVPYATVLLVATLASPLMAETNSSATKPELAVRAGSPELARGDRAFLEKASKAGMKEIDISQVVIDRLTHPEVKAVAEMMISDHTAANSELTSLAYRKGLTLPPDERSASEKWGKKTKDLDEDYLKEMQDDHEDAVELFEKAMKSSDTDIALFAGKTLPALQHHLSMVKEARKAVK